MTNSGSAQQGTTILQYAQTPDGQQILVPSNQVVVQSKYGDIYGISYIKKIYNAADALKEL